MRPEEKFRQAFAKFTDTKQDELVRFSGFLGDGHGNVSVPNRANYDYCLINGQVAEVKNTRVPPTHGLPVVVGYSPDEPQILKVLDVRSTDNIGNVTTLVGGYAPAKRYQWMAPGGGEDPLYVELRQFLYGRLSCGVSDSPLAVQIIRNVVYTPSSGSPWTYEDNPVKDLSSYVPAQSGSAVAVLITSGSVGQIVATSGSPVPLANLTVSDVPAPPTGTTQVYGAVRMYNGQTGIYEGRTNSTDIIDLRLSGWCQGGSSGSGSFDIKIDGSAIGSAETINLISGTNVTISASAISATEIDITINSSGSGGSSGSSVYPTRATIWADELLVTTGCAIQVAENVAASRYDTYCRQTTCANGDSFTHSFMLASGSYTFSVLGYQSTDEGKLDWEIDGTTIITSQDWYGASDTPNITKTASISITGNGRHKLKCTVNGKHASSSNYYYRLTKFWFTPSSDASEVT